MISFPIRRRHKAVGTSGGRPVSGGDPALRHQAEQGGECGRQTMASTVGLPTRSSYLANFCCEMRFLPRRAQRSRKVFSLGFPLRFLCALRVLGGGKALSQQKPANFALSLRRERRAQRFAKAFLWHYFAIPSRSSRPWRWQRHYPLLHFLYLHLRVIEDSGPAHQIAQTGVGVLGVGAHGSVGVDAGLAAGIAHDHLTVD